MFWTFMLVLVTVIAVTQVAISEETSTRYQTLPSSTTRDYGAPSYVTRGQTTYPTLPGSSTRDYGSPSYVTHGNTTYQTLPRTPEFDS